jgi:hypothetical protein
MKWIVGWCLVLTLASGCGALKTRSEVPKDQITTVHLEGYDHCRY